MLLIIHERGQSGISNTPVEGEVVVFLGDLDRVQDAVEGGVDGAGVCGGDEFWEEGDGFLELGEVGDELGVAVVLLLGLLKLLADFA